VERGQYGAKNGEYCRYEVKTKKCFNAPLVEQSFQIIMPS